MSKTVTVSDKMQSKTFFSEVYPRGQFTIPDQIRRDLKIRDGSVLSVLEVGNTIILTPRKLTVPQSRKAIMEIMKGEGVTKKELLEGLKEERNRYNKERYGLKT